MGRGASRGHLLAALDASLERLGLDYVDLWQLHAWDEATPLEETLAACDLAVSSGPRPLHRHQQLHRLADRAGRHLAARLARPHAGGQHAGRVLAAAARRRARGRAGRRGARPRRPAVVAARPRAADRQVPAQHAVGVPRRLAAVAGLHRRAALGEVRPDRRGRDHRGRGPGHHAAGRRAGLGARPARASSRRSSAPAPPSSCRPRLDADGRAAARRDPHRAGGRLGARRSAIPSAGRKR